MDVTPKDIHGTGWMGWKYLAGAILFQKTKNNNKPSSVIA